MSGERRDGSALIAQIVASIGLLASAACTSSRPILVADLAAVRPGEMAEATRDQVVLSAGLLAKSEARKQLHLDAPKRHVLPVTFHIQNGSAHPLRIDREDFVLRLNERWRLAPVLPGRAAALLRDTSGSRGAAIAGWLLFGVLAAPSINAAEHQEEETLARNPELLFDGGQIATATSLTGYLLFEAPVDLDDLTAVELQLKPSWGEPAETTPLSLRLVNPYAD